MKTAFLILATACCCAAPAQAALQHYWALDTNTYNFTAFGNPWTGYEDTGAAAAKVPLFSNDVALDSTTQILGGGAANFNVGVSSHMRRDDDNPGTLTPANLTCAVWVKRTGDWGTGGHPIVAAKNWWSYNGDGWYLSALNGGTNIQVVLSGTQSFHYDAGSQIFPLNTWVQVTITFNSTTKAYAIYIDSLPVTTSVPAGWSTPDFITPTTPEFRLGHDMYWEGASLALGELDDVGIWNEELSATRVKALANLANTNGLAYGQGGGAALFNGFDTGTAGDSGADAVVGITQWYKVSSGLTGSDGDVVDLGGGNYALNLGGGAGMTQILPTLTSSNNPSLAGSNVTFSVTVQTNGTTAGGAGGTVTFLDGLSPLATVPVINGQATFTTSSLLAGGHTIWAQYRGDNSYPASLSSIGQLVPTDDFGTSRNFLAEGVANTIWDGFIYRVNGGNGTLTAANANSSNPGQLTLASANGNWGGGGTANDDDGPLLYKNVTGDFDAQVQVVSASSVDSHDLGLMARRPGMSAANENFVSARYFQGSGAGSNSTRNLTNSIESNTDAGGSMQPWLRLTRVGNVFTTYRSTDGINWSSMRGVARNDLDGVPMQVGIWQATFSANTGVARFDNFVLKTGTVTPYISEPLLSGQDPQVAFKDGLFHLIQSDGCRLWLRTAASLGGLATVEPTVIHTPGCYGDWAPEIHWHAPSNTWFVYYSEDTGAGMRVRVLQSAGTSPNGPYVDKGMLWDGAWHIDGSIFTSTNGQMYFMFSSWTGPNQNQYIAPMSNPYTLSGPPVLLSTPTQPWERNGLVNEGPYGFVRNGRAFIVYSGSGCWTDDYCLGLLTLTGNDPLDINSWTKSGPVFSKLPAASAYGPGHNGIVTDTAGQWWNVYHANNNSGEGCGGLRKIRAQRIFWDAGDTPRFGTPVPTNSLVVEDANFLVAQYPLTATHGNVAANATGGPAGMFQGAPVWQNPGLKFNGVSDYVDGGSALGNDVQFQLTLAAWIKADAFTDWAGIITKGVTASPYAMQLWRDGSLRFTANYGAPGGALGNGSWNSSAKLVTNQWQHVAVTYDGTTIRFYTNGVLDSYQPAAALRFGVVNESLTLGADLPGSDEYFGGTIAAARVYGRPLSGAEIAALASDAPANTYATWATANGAAADPAADSNHNGVADGIEFFMGGTLANPATLPPLVTAAGTVTWTIPYVPSVAATWRFQVSDDLTGWTDAPPGDEKTSILTAPDRIRLTLPAATTKKFCRLSVTPNP